MELGINSKLFSGVQKSTATGDRVKVNLRTGTLVFVIVSDRNLTQRVRSTKNINILKNTDLF